MALLSGTWIATSIGPRLIEDLAEGDMVLTLDRGAQPVRRMRRQHMSAARLASEPWHKPFLYDADGLDGEDADPVFLSGDQRVLMRRWEGDAGVLVLASTLSVERPDLCRRTTFPSGVTWLQPVFDAHEVITADGFAVESGWVAQQHRASRPFIDSLQREVA